jgi:hypothetical protein
MLMRGWEHHSEIVTLRSGVHRRKMGVEGNCRRRKRNKATESR